MTAIGEIILNNARLGCEQWTRWPRIRARTIGATSLIKSDIDFVLYNCITRLAPDKSADLKKALAIFRSKGVGACCLLGPEEQTAGVRDALEDAGFTLTSNPIGMAALPVAILEPQSRALAIEEVVEEELLDQWNDIVCGVFEFPETARKSWKELHVAVGLGPTSRWRHFVGFCEGNPVAAASCFTDQRSVAVANVAVLSAYRGRGFGHAITFGAIRAQGTAAVATLVALSSAAGMYRKMGFKDYWTAEYFTR